MPPLNSIGMLPNLSSDSPHEFDCHPFRHQIDIRACLYSPCPAYYTCCSFFLFADTVVLTSDQAEGRHRTLMLLESKQVDLVPGIFMKTPAPRT